jgi:hypothetical protein
VCYDKKIEKKMLTPPPWAMIKKLWQKNIEMKSYFNKMKEY